MNTVDEAIDRVEQLFAMVTGTRPPEVQQLSPIPPEKDPVEYVSEQLARLLDALQRRVPIAPTTPAPSPMPLASSPRAFTWFENDATVFAIDLRSFAIPNSIPPDRLVARLEGGILTVRVPHHVVSDAGTASNRS